MANINGEEPLVEGSAPNNGATEEGGSTPLTEEKENAVQKRINKITGEKYAEKRRADAAEEKLSALERSALAQGALENAEAPTLENFDYDDEKYLNAKVTREVETALAQRDAQMESNDREARRRHAAVDFGRKVAAANIPGYGEAILTLTETVPLHDGVLEAIQAHERGPELAYYLGTNLDVAAEVAAMEPLEAALTLGRISAALPDTKNKKITGAPDPIVPAAAGGGASTKTLDEMSMEEIDALEL